MTVRFSIKWKLTLAFASLVILPALVAQLVTRYAVVSRFGREFDARVDAVAEQAHAEYSRSGEELASRISGLFEGSDEDTTVFDRYLAELRQGPLSEKNQKDLIDALPSITRGAGLDVFRLVDKSGIVIAQTPLGGREGHKDPQALILMRDAPRKPLLLWERLPAANGGAEEHLLISVAVEVTRYGAPLYAIGGHVVSNDFLHSLIGQSQAEIGLASTEKALFGDLKTLEALPHREIKLAGFQDNHLQEDLYRVVVAVSDANQREAVAELTLVSGAVVAAGVLAAWILGFIIARRFTRPIDDLVHRAEEVARGDLKGELPKNRNDEVGDLISSFNEMTRRLAESQERLRHAERVAAWQEIARRLAHEIKNPLFPIQMSVETLRKTFDRKDFKEIFEESTTAVLEEVERLKKIVSEFSQFARLPEPKFTPVDLKSVASAAIKLCAAANEEAKINVVTHFDADVPSLPADREQLTQILLNLLSNASEAMPQGGTLTVSLKRHNNEAQLSVSDTGVGLSEEAKAKIFTPYFTTKEKGTGLGLAIVHRIMTGHSGRISLNGKEGQGATFTLHFPIA